jgi:CelD/BcsL family acetyltransferase involved in cellulose biosynthesis
MTDTASRFEIVSDEAEFRALQSDWDALWLRAHGFYYQSFSFCWLAWQEVAKPHGRHLRCVVSRDADGRLAMVWPLVTYQRLLWTFVVPLGPEGYDYSSVLVEDGPAASALIGGAWDAARQRCGADFVRVPCMKEEVELYRLVSKEPRFAFSERDTWVVARLRDETSWERYCSTLGTLFGKKPGAAERRFAKEGRLAVRMVDASARDEAASIIDWMLECKRGWGERVGKHGDWLNSASYRNFLVHLISSTDVPPVGRLIVVSLNDAPVAAAVLGVGNPCASAIISGFDARYGKFCPGSIAWEHAVKWAFEQRYDLDFGVGGERFKAFWGRGNIATVWTIQTINSEWGMLAVRGRWVMRGMIGMIRRIGRIGRRGRGVAVAAPAGEAMGSEHELAQRDGAA